MSKPQSLWQNVSIRISFACGGGDTAYALDASIIISDEPPFPESYCKSAHYIDRLEYDYDLDELLKKS